MRRHILIWIFGIILMTLNLEANANALELIFKNIFGYSDETIAVSKSTTQVNNINEVKSIKVSSIEMTLLIHALNMENKNKKYVYDVLISKDEITYQDLVKYQALTTDDLLSLKSSGKIKSDDDIVSPAMLEWFYQALKINNICPEDYRPNQRDEGIPDFDDPCITTSTVP